MPIDPEELLWELSALAEDENAPIPDDQVLQDFRQGRLAAGQAEQVERLLARSQRARQRLGELAEISPVRPSPELRQRVLTLLPARRPGWLGWQRAVLAVAAMVLMILAVRLFWLDSPSPGLVPDYQIRVFALAEERDMDAPRRDPDQALPVDPRTPVRIELSARGAATDQVSYGLYRLQDGRLTRLGADQGVRLQTPRGAAIFEAAGFQLAPRSGRWQLFALAASPGRLPGNLPLQQGESPEDALREASSGGQVFLIRLEMSPKGGFGNQ